MPTVGSGSARWSRTGLRASTRPALIAARRSGIDRAEYLGGGDTMPAPGSGQDNRDGDRQPRQTRHGLGCVRITSGRQEPMEHRAGFRRHSHQERSSRVAGEIARQRSTAGLEIKPEGAVDGKPTARRSEPGDQGRLRPGNRRRWRRVRDQHGGERPGRRTSVDLRYRTAVSQTTTARQLPAICSTRPASDLGVISGDSGYPCRSWPTTLTCGPSHVTYRRLTFLLP